MVKNIDQVKQFVTAGLLPENLPPVFSTGTLWEPFENLGQTYAVTGAMIGEYATYNASKRGGQRRIFGMPHPIFIRDQALFFLKHWNHIEGLISTSPGSVSKPEIGKNDLRIVGITPHADLPRKRLISFSRFQYCLVTDVARFYPSIYTHTIPWIINGKAEAKADGQSNSATVFGNKLDFLLRQTQSRQTIGMPVGPDTSKVISELIMSAVDKEFLRLSGRNKPVFVRHVDDIWIGGDTIEECEKHLHNVGSALRSYQLDINELKTKIVSTRDVIGDFWPFDLVNNFIKSFGWGSDLDPVVVMRQIIDIASKENDEGLLRFTLRKLDEARLWNANWDILEHFLAQCSVQFPHSFDYAARVVVWRIRTGREINRGLWQHVTKSILLRHASVGHDSEVVWALWVLKELKVRLAAKLTTPIIENCGTLPLAFLAHCASKKLAVDKNIKKKLWNAVDGNLCAGSFWPLTLEMVHLNMAHPDWAASIAQLPKSLRLLHDNKLSLIAWDAMPKVFVGDDDHYPEYAIEDYGSDYGEDTGDWEDDDDSDLDWAPGMTPEADLVALGLLPNSTPDK